MVLSPLRLYLRREGSYMNADRVFNLLGAIVLVTLVTTLVAHKNTANVVKAFGGAFNSSLKTASGQKKGGGY